MDAHHPDRGLGRLAHRLDPLTLGAVEAPLYGRAHVLFELRPLDPTWLPSAFPNSEEAERVEAYAAWGGVPRYWELAAGCAGRVTDRIDRLLQEEAASALEVRPVLDAIGGGVHRVSEIAGRIGRPATSMSRPLKRLVELGLVRRDSPFGESPRASRRALYKIDDPFVRLWFRVVAPQRAQPASATPAGRRRLLQRSRGGLVAEAWEDLCRQRVPGSAVPGACAWGPASRWWRGGMAEWGVVSESEDGRRLLLGEAKWSRKAFTQANLARALRALAGKPVPALPSRFARHEVVCVLFVPTIESGISIPNEPAVVTASALLVRTT